MSDLTRAALAQAHIAQLLEGIKSVESLLRGEVHTRQASLLQQADSLREAQAFMQVPALACVACAAT